MRSDAPRPASGNRFSPTWHGTLFVLGLAAFAWLYKETYTFFFFDEDFGWMYRSATSDFISMLRPLPGIYYRPAAVNLPFYFFTGSLRALYVWVTLIFLLAAAGACALRYGPRYPGAPALGTVAAILWICAPFQAMPIFYLNAFDYILYPVSALCLVWALRREVFAAALFCFVLCAFSKEQGPAFVALPLFLRQKAPRWYWAATLSVVAAWLFVHRGIAVENGLVSGYEISWRPAEWLSQTGRLAYGFVVRANTPVWGPRWHALAWAFVAGTLALQLRERRFEGFRFIAGILAFEILIHTPLVFLPDIWVSNLGSGFWGVLLFATVETAGSLPPPKVARLALFTTPLALAAVFLLWSFEPGLENFYRSRSLYYEELLRSVDPFLRRCNRYDRVVIRMEDGSLPTYREYKNILWALRWKYRPTRFYLRKPANFPGDPLEPYLWVDDEQSRGHPKVAVVRKPDIAFEVTGTGDPGCGARL